MGFYKANADRERSGFGKEVSFFGLPGFTIYRNYLFLLQNLRPTALAVSP